MLFPEPVNRRLQMDEAVAAKAAVVPFGDKGFLVITHCYAKALALCDIAGFTGKIVAAARALLVFVIRHIPGFEDKPRTYAITRPERRIVPGGKVRPVIRCRQPGCRRSAG